MSKPIFKTETHGTHHYVYGVVYSPLQVDTDWETMCAEDIRKMAHNFLAEARVSEIDLMHDSQPCGAVVVESFIARKGDPDYPEGAWVLGVRMEEGPIWEAVRTGKLNGFSVGGIVQKAPKTVLVDLVQISSGSTESNTDTETLPAHQHEFYVEFSEDGRVSFGSTSEVLGHTHRITGTVVTGESLGHTHRYFVG